MDPSLHQKQGINHLNRVLSYYPFVAEDGKAAVHLTPEDWHVVADTLFRMETPKELLPEAIESFTMAESGEAIELRTADCSIELSIM